MCNHKNREAIAAERDALGEDCRIHLMKRHEVEAERDRLQAQLDGIRAIHAPVDALHTPTGRRVQVCSECERDGDWRTWPCPTIRALETRP